MQVGGVLGLPLRILDALQQHPSRGWNLIEILSEPAPIASIRNTIHPRKDVQVQTAHDIIRVVVVRNGWLPAQCHLSSFSALALVTR